ncbi:transposase [Agriterribacter sp.]|uniref:transposase n=1 Tax=Agriterribacter sp. TaxID=2821509 RepID=UPI002BDB2F56|nr:transposase [Agriterribacter sp.]HTN08435.1 transposase [Agriterribacter sp.]
MPEFFRGNIMQGSNTTFIYIHAIWCTAGKQPVLTPIVRKVLFACMKKSPEEKGIQVIAVNGGDEHVHCLFKLMPVQSVSAIINQLKSESENWLNNNKFLPDPFEWDDVYSAWSVSPSTIDKAVEYISRQEAYHQEKTLAEELTAFDRMVIHMS